MLKKLSILLVIIAALFFIFFNFMLEGIVKNKLQQMLEDTFESYYQLSFESNYTSLTPSGFTIGFTGVDLKTDTTNVKMMSKFAPIFFSAAKLEVNDISVSNLLFNTSIELGTFELSEPNLVFLIGKTKQAPGTDSDNLGINPIKAIEAHDFRLIGGSAAFVFAQNQKDTLYAGKDLNASFQDLDLLISNSGVHPQDISIGQFQIDLNEVLYNPQASSYEYRMSKMKVDYTAGTLQCQNVDLIPKRSLYEMTLDESYQKTMFDIAIGEFIVEEINFDSLKDDGAFRASTAMLKDGNFTLLRNANYPLDPQPKELMHESLAKSTFPIDLDTLFIQNATIDYALIPKGRQKPGKVLLTNINGQLAGLYNEESKKDTLRLFLSSDFLEHGQFTFSANFPMNTVPEHTYSGHISQLPFKDLNSIVTPMVDVELTDGKIEDVYFTGVCNDTMTYGQMIFDYDKLKLQVDKVQKEKKNWFLTDIGNLIVRHHSKKEKDGRSKAVDFQYERPVYQGHIGFYLNGILDGMMKNLLPNPAYKVAVKGMKPKTDNSTE